MTHFRSFSYATFKGWMDALNFQEVDLPGTVEHAFERVIVSKRTVDRPDRFKVQILSSVDKRTGVTREVGNDAIRIMVIDTRRNKPVTSWTVNRTINAHRNVIKRAREAWGYVSQHCEHHCACGSLMVKRKGTGKAFFGCTAFPDCKQTRPIIEA